MTKWELWLDRVTRGASSRAIAAAIGASNVTVSRWLRDSKVSAEGAVQIARAFDADPIEALVAADYLTEEDMKNAGTLRELRSATALQLIEELMRRSLVGQLPEGVFDPK